MSEAFYAPWKCDACGYTEEPPRNNICPTCGGRMGAEVTFTINASAEEFVDWLTEKVKKDGMENAVEIKVRPCAKPDDPD